jgi:DNA-binding MarR family transcriptional regulator
MKRVRGKTVFYPTNMIDDADVDLLAMFNDHQVKHVFTAIRNNPGITQKALSNLLATSHQTIILHTGRLEDAGFITSIKDGKYNRYYPTDKITKKNDSYYKRIREFREHVLKTFKQDGIKPELVRSTEKGIIIRITAGEAQAVLELSTYPFTTVFF